MIHASVNEPIPQGGRNVLGLVGSTVETTVGRANNSLGYNALAGDPDLGPDDDDLGVASLNHDVPFRLFV